MMNLIWRAADPDLSHLVSAFVEREDCRRIGPSVEFPLAVPLMQIMLGADYRLQSRERMEPIPQASLWGTSSRARRAIPDGRIHAFVALLTFRGARLFARDLRTPLADRVVDLQPLLGDAESGFPEQLRHAFSFEERVRLSQLLFRRTLSDAPAAAAFGSALDVAQAIASHRLRGPVAAIAQSCGVTTRTLSSRFHDEIGLSPKRLQRVARLNRVVRTLHPRPWGGRPDHDVLLEFHDEAHLYHEFRSLTELAPGAFVAGKRRTGDALVHSYILHEPRRSEQPGKC
jgi:AraC-like DNA-binding protein